MPSGVPTCAARVIRNNFLEYGWGATLPSETNKLVRSISGEASAMYRMQTSRSRPVDSISLISALFWEHRQLDQQGIVSTPRILAKISPNDDLELFCREKEYSKEAIGKIRKTVDGGMISMHPVFGPIRHREFTLWPIAIDDIFVTIILRIESRPATLLAPKKFFDKTVTEYAIIDPFAKGRAQRREFLKRRLARVLAEGCIEFPAEATVKDIVVSDIKESWTAGHVAYAISREFLRRLKVLIHRRQSPEKNQCTDFLWSEFEEDYNVDAYRESIMAGCAHHTIENSGYLVRMALEVPSPKSGHNPETLVSPVYFMPDELYKTSVPFTEVTMVPVEPRSEEKEDITVCQDIKDESESKDSDYSDYSDDSYESDDDNDDDDDDGDDDYDNPKYWASAVIHTPLMPQPAQQEGAPGPEHSNNDEVPRSERNSIPGPIPGLRDQDIAQILSDADADTGNPIQIDVTTQAVAWDIGSPKQAIPVSMLYVPEPQVLPPTPNEHMPPSLPVKRPVEVEDEEEWPAKKVKMDN
ncbi:hypothetical protein GGR54DRAFT_626752 [Hypoxylon sp. NC1633]|nr:hypothetical protein GGR54DRAFT_626752 [Hypoxylon sp. NC1633]